MTGRSFCIFLGIFSGMTILSEVTNLSEVTTLSESTNSSGVTTLETSFLSSLVTSVSLSVNVSNMFICFKGFLSCLQLNSIGAKGVD